MKEWEGEGMEEWEVSETFEIISHIRYLSIFRRTRCGQRAGRETRMITLTLAGPTIPRSSSL